MAEALKEYEWILVLSAFAAVFAAFGIGANDVANAWATSVGAKSLTIRQASFIALFAEAGGAILAGSSVADTFKSGIADPKCFDNNRNDAALLMYGNMMVIITVGFWLITATLFEMPVSTTHTAVGGMIGMAIAIKGTKCVIWTKETGDDSLHIPKGVAGIVASWIFSPFLSMLFAMLLFAMVRSTILRSKNSFQRAVRLYPILIFFAVWVNGFFILAKGITKKICPNKDTTFFCHQGKMKVEVAVWMSLVIALAVTVMLTPLYFKIGRWASEFVEQQKALADVKEAVKANSINADVSNDVVMSRTTSYAVAIDVDGKTKEDEANGIVVNGAMHKHDEEEEVVPCGIALQLWISRKWARFIHLLKTWPDIDVHDTSMDRSSAHSIQIQDMHEAAEVFDNDAEAVFRYIQVFTAICDSFAHGANDVSNAMGPFMTVYAVYHAGKVKKNYDSHDDSYWILAVGGFGMGLGLFAYGYKIIRAIGVKLAKVTPSRGFSIELGAAIVIILGSYLGIPLSTTHCQVGATAGVGILEGKGGVNKRTLIITVLGWILTLVIAGVGAGLLTAQGVYAPSVESLHDDDEPF